jgi:CheY-like chemotaxis protein
VPEGGTGGIILVAEDDWLISTDLIEQLEAGGFSTLGPAPTVSAALQLIGTEQIDAALLDVRLGDQDAYPLAEALRERRIPFALVTGYTPDGIREDFRVETIIAKPVAEGAVVSVTRGLVARRTIA